jgi:predicted ATPase
VLGIGRVLPLIGLWGIGKSELYKVFHHFERCTKAAQTVASGGELSLTLHVTHPSAKVLKGLEERKKTHNCNKS